jgi:hypothetical protein
MNRLLALYAHERWLARLSVSDYRDHFVLKGGLYLYSQYPQQFARPTRDLDMLGRNYPNQVDALTHAFAEVARITLADGVTFDATAITVHAIQEGANYRGTRLKVPGRLGNTRLMVQVDVAFGDVVYPAPHTITYPTLLDDQPTDDLQATNMLVVWAYNPETVVAEKWHAMTVLGSRNSRSKDLYDLWLLSRQQAFTADVLQTTLRRTFARRQTPLSDSHGLLARLAQSPEPAQHWQQFRTTSPRLTAPNAFSELLADLTPFLEPLSQQTATGHWQPPQYQWQEDSI